MLIINTRIETVNQNCRNLNGAIRDNDNLFRGFMM